MLAVLQQILLKFEVMLLVLARISGMFFMSPVFGRRNVPSIFTIGLMLSLTCLTAAYYPGQQHPIYISSYIQLFYYIIKELLIGLIMGYIVFLTFSAFLLAGQLMDTQIGFGIVHVLDPHSNIQIPLVGNFNNVVAMVFFFAIDGHHTLIRLLMYSFEILPPGKAMVTSDLTVPIVNMFIEFFILGLKIAIPVIASAFLAEVMFGILVRAIPQMNIFVIGLPFKILVGLVVLFLMVPVYVSVINGAFNSMFKGIKTIIQGLSLQ